MQDNLEQQLAAFADDHEYFEAVRPIMAGLMHASGDRLTLQEAYDRAVQAWTRINPTELH